MQYHIRVVTADGHGQCDLQRTVTVLIDSLQQRHALRHSVTLRFAHKVSLDLLLFPRTTAHQPLMDQGLFIVEASRSYPGTPHSIGFLWASDQPDAETST